MYESVSEFILVRFSVSFSRIVCTIDWMTPVHDGPVKVLAKSPFIPNLLLSVGGYSFGVWNEGVMVRFSIIY